MAKDTIIDPEWEREQQERLKRTLRGRDADVSGFDAGEAGDYDMNDMVGREVLKTVRRRRKDDVSFDEPEVAPWDEAPAGKKPVRGVASEAGDNVRADLSASSRNMEDAVSPVAPGGKSAAGNPDGETADGAGENLSERPMRKPSKVKEYVGSILSGNILSKAEVRKLYPYLLFVAFLMLLYISNVFRMQQLHKQHDTLVRQVKELRAKSLTISAMRVNSTRQSAILDEIKLRGMDLHESLVPPKVIGK